MIHQVSKLPRARRLLTHIVALQTAVLEVAATESKDAVCDGAAFFDELKAHLETKKRFGRKPGQASEVAEWVMRKQTTLLKPLACFAAASPSQKEDFVQRIRHDVMLLYWPKAESLRVAILRDADEWEKGAKDFLCAFYDLWSAHGFATCLFSPPLVESYTRQHFVREFEERNPDLYLCAICDASAYRTITDSRLYTSVEHFFPRSIYPHLSCHPYNLIPICSSCNSFIKGEKDPMDKNTLTDLILPYQGQGLRKLAYITLQPRDSWKKGLHPLTIKMKPVQGVDLGRKLEAFNDLYQVEERWDSELEQIEEQAFRRMCQFFALDLAMGTPLTDCELVREKMDLLMAFTDRDNLGRDPFAFPLIWMLKGYIDQLRDRGEEAIVFKELKAWADSHGPRWQELRELAENIHRRVPQ